MSNVLDGLDLLRLEGLLNLGYEERDGALRVAEQIATRSMVYANACEMRAH